MAGKRYYWLKLKDDIFSSRRIKKLRNLENGDTLFVIYLKLQLLAMKHDGELKHTGLEDTMEEELSLDLSEPPELIRRTLEFLLKYELAEQTDQETIFLPYAIENTGSETASTLRVREFRARKALQCNTNETQMKQKGNGEQETDIEKEQEAENGWQAEYIYPDNKALFLAFCQDHDIDLDFAGLFYDRYTANGWRDGNGEPVRIWQNLLFEAWRKEKTEQSKAEARQEQRLPKPTYTTADLIEYPYGSGLYRPRQEVEGLGDG